MREPKGKRKRQAYIGWTMAGSSSRWSEVVLALGSNLVGAQGDRQGAGLTHSVRSRPGVNLSAALQFRNSNHSQQGDRGRHLWQALQGMRESGIQVYAWRTCIIC